MGNEANIRCYHHIVAKGNKFRIRWKVTRLEHKIITYTMK